MKNIQKTESCKPKPSVSQKESPFKHTTQYQNDYKRLRQTKSKLLQPVNLLQPILHFSIASLPNTTTPHHITVPRAELPFTFGKDVEKRRNLWFTALLPFRWKTQLVTAQSFITKIPVEQKRTIWDPNHRIYKITAENANVPCTGLANDEKDKICNRIKCGEDICSSVEKENCAPYL
ncbi:hypothetical protein CEXT_687551 [Caerostris extrusa]|uniref:Uncharacterized protein n=1 Tax=Caerostris extrusa TaxID=172846 RepID=A0AAV4T3B0_CAEEX|nr:hypothetical protein CEXT_687551 [Caerostris extrusa]